VTDNLSLIVVRPDGTADEIENSYESIKAALDGGTLDFVPSDPRMGVFVDDDGISKRLAMNVPMSCLTGRLLYGPIVVCNAETDDEGETQAPDDRVRRAALGLALLWRRVWVEAEHNGQDIKVHANPDTQRPAEIIELTEDEFMQYLATGQVPRGGKEHHEEDDQGAGGR
jgi:hypothetical protein